MPKKANKYKGKPKKIPNQELILRNRAQRQLKKLNIFDVSGENIYKCSMEKLHKFFLEQTGDELTNRSREYTKRNLKGFIYLIKGESECQNYCKIGFSNDPNIRIKGMQTNCPLKLTKETFFKGSIPLEKELHGLLEEYHVRGEWFIYCEELLKIFKDYRKMVTDKY